MAELSKEIQTFIVQELAMYSTPQEIVELVKETFDTEVSRQQVFYYNSDRNPELPRKWKAIFKKTREKFLNNTASIGIAQKSYRLRELDTIYQKQKSSKTQNTKAMKDTLQQAAKEDGTMFRHEHTGKNGNPMETHNIEMSLADWKKQSAARTAQAAETLEMFEDDSADEN